MPWKLMLFHAKQNESNHLKYFLDTWQASFIHKAGRQTTSLISSLTLCQKGIYTYA